MSFFQKIALWGVAVLALSVKAWALPADETIEQTLVVADALIVQTNTGVDLAAYTGFAKVIDRAQFEYSFSSFSELLNRVEGVQVRSIAGVGSYSATSLRGSTGKQVNYYLDGLLLNSASSGEANIQYIPSILIESVEVYPDFTPAELGNANLAGAIHFSSRALKHGETGGRLSASYGSFGTHNLELSAWGELQGWQVLSALSDTSAANDFSTPSTPASPYRQNSAFEQTALFTKVRGELASAVVDVMYQRSDVHKGVPTVVNRPSDHAFIDETEQRLQGGVDYDLGLWAIGHRLQLYKGDSYFNDAASSVGLNANEHRQKTQGFGILGVAKRETRWGNSSLTLDAAFDDVDQNDVLDAYALDAERQRVVLAIANEYDANDVFSVTAVVRYYLVDDDTREQSSLLLSREGDSVSESAFQLGAKYQLSQHLAARFNLGRLIRVPTLLEKFGGQGLFIGDTDLRHEQAMLMDVGVDYNWANIELTMAGFYKQVDDGIHIVYDSRGIARPQNIGEVTVLGFESELNLSFGKAWQINANLTLLETENGAEIKAFKGKKLPGIYHQEANLGVSYTTPRNQYLVSYRFQDEFYFTQLNGVPAEAVEDVSLSWQHSYRHCVLNVALSNVFDKQNMSFYRFPSPGRSFTTTLTYNF